MVDHTMYTLRALTDDALLLRLTDLVAQERESLADVVEHLMEVDRRELCLSRGYSSLYDYCVRKLGYSKQAAYFRMRAAQAAQEFPDVISRLRSGLLHLDAVVRLYPHLNRENQAELLARVEGATEREVKALVANLKAEPAPERDRIIAFATGREEPAAPMAIICPSESASQTASVVPSVIPPSQHRFHFTGDNELLSMIDRLRGFLRHKYPDGRLEGIFKDAARTLLEKLEKDRRPNRLRFNTTQAEVISRPSRMGSRVVPRTIKRKVWARDGGRCAYIAPDGQRCIRREMLEYDHIVAWADGGRSDVVENIRLLCRPHNQWLGRRRFGDRRTR